MHLEVDLVSIPAILPHLPLFIPKWIMPLSSNQRSTSMPKGSDMSYSRPSGVTSPLSEADTLVEEDTEPCAVALLQTMTRIGTGNLPQVKPKKSPRPPLQLSDVDWKYGRQGIALVDNAREESKETREQGATTPFERSAYIDGVSYLLKGLPRDLDETEVTVLRKALRSPLVVPPPAGSVRRASTARDVRRKRSIVHRVVQMFVAQAIVCFCAVWPYALLMFHYMTRFERRYNLARGLIALNVGLASAFAGHGKNIAVAFNDMLASRTGQTIADTLSHALESMASGISDGVVEGCSKIAAR